MTYRLSACSMLVLLTIVGSVGAPRSSLADEPPAKAKASKSTKLTEEQVASLALPLIEGEVVSGLSIGVLQEGKRGAWHFGRLSVEHASPPDDTTVFEIGSITKVFTGLLLADGVQRGEWTLEDSVQSLLPADVELRAKGDRPMRLLDLATHASGLPRLPTNLAPANPGDPYADYDSRLLFESLRSFEPTTAPGESVEYSNLGAGLLGELLARKSGKSYEALLRDRILDPLEMGDTFLAKSKDRPRIAPGHDGDGNEVGAWEFEALAGAGAIRSNLNDMLKFLAANLDPENSSLRDAIVMSHSPRRAFDAPPGDIGLFWLISPDGKVIWHNGGTGGFHSFLGYEPKARRGVVILCNTSSDVVDRLGFDLLSLMDGKTVTPPKVRKVVTLPEDSLDDYPGKFELAPGVILEITRDGARFKVQLTGQAAYPIYPEAKDEFFFRIVDAQLSFTRDDAGKIDKVTLRQGGRDIPAKRVDP